MVSTALKGYKMTYGDWRAYGIRNTSMKTFLMCWIFLKTQVLAILNVVSMYWPLSIAYSGFNKYNTIEISSKWTRLIILKVNVKH